ncbi:MAG TPA: hybrid sensor histidine kinase/response regulator [Methylomusa anaerophila]|uniref:histidine kinase n=1 Tax=Methylomusa anaerophila TaxID=1930071 RepID=A0A348AGV2_9FIRM|nr:hybrid sensor histidine kinase/response regulator [Methylomusa anaerophila]BBB90300.1 phytochrome-like protein cph1 [Methylomusa anaerophila]HML89355.1 hybrid sensor histidine kinase/response regulator [Methylomusa anaerophila]
MPIPNYTILIVDDNSNNLFTLRTIIEENIAARVIEAKSGEEALRILLNETVDLIILDVHMAGMDGFETAAIIKQRKKMQKIPIVFLTAACITGEFKKRGFKTGAVDYLIKPIDDNLLINKINVYLKLNKKDFLLEYFKDMQAIILEREEELKRKNEELEAQKAEAMEANRLLQHYAAELENTNKELQNFANIIAHDFRTPMVNLKGFSKELGNALADLKQILQDAVAHLPAKVQKEANKLIGQDVPDAVQFINSAVDRLDRMIAALLKLSREGRRDMIYQQVDCNKLIKAVLLSFDHQIVQKGIHVAVGSMPTIETDYLALEQIIGNLLDNAIKYLEPSRPGKIDVFCLDKEDEYLFTIQDNGCGISSQDQEKVFEIFRRGGNQEVPGEGMGLAYVKTIIRQLKGKVWCESELGIGTKISFSLPKKPLGN